MSKSTSSASEGATASRTIDVLVPVYDAAPTVESAIRSILSQTHADLRVIVVDDGSTDETPKILARIGASDSRVVVITTENRGIVDALNTALAAATARYVARHDADDIAFPHRFEVQLSYLENHPDCVAVGCNVFHIDAHGSRTGHTTAFDTDVASDPYCAPSTEPYLLHPFLLAKRDALLEAGGYRHSFHSEDTDLYWRLRALGGLVNLPDALGEYRVHSNSVSGRSILNGRIAAVDSQRAAVSEQRRRGGKADLLFPKELLARYHTAASLRGILDLASAGMSASEKSYLEIASAAKLLELSSYRPYRMERDDLETVRGLVEKHWHALSDFDRRQLVFRSVLDRRRRERDAWEVWRLVPWKILPRALWRLGTFVVRKRLRRLRATT